MNTKLRAIIPLLITLPGCATSPSTIQNTQQVQALEEKIRHLEQSLAAVDKSNPQPPAYATQPASTWPSNGSQEIPQPCQNVRSLPDHYASCVLKQTLSLVSHWPLIYSFDLMLVKYTSWHNPQGHPNTTIGAAIHSFDLSRWTFNCDDSTFTSPVQPAPKSEMRLQAEWWCQYYTDPEIKTYIDDQYASAPSVRNQPVDLTTPRRYDDMPVEHGTVDHVPTQNDPVSPPLTGEELQI